MHFLCSAIYHYYQMNLQPSPSIDNSSHSLGLLYQRLQNQFNISSAPKEDIHLRIYMGSKESSSFHQCYALLAILGTLFALLAFTLYYSTSNALWLDGWRKGVDESNNKCGFGKTSEYPLLYFYNPMDASRAVCVKACPGAQDLEAQCYNNDETACKTYFNITDPSHQFVVYKSFNYMDSICIPTSIQYFNMLQTAFDVSSWNLIFSDFWTMRYIILIICFVLVTCRTLASKCIRISEINVWLTIFAFVALAAIMGVLSFQFYRSTLIQNENPPNSNDIDIKFVRVNTNKPISWLALTLSLTIILSFYIISAYIYRHFPDIGVLQDCHNIITKYMDRLQYPFVLSLFALLKLIILWVGLMSICYSAGPNKVTNDQLPMQNNQINSLCCISIFVTILLVWAFISLVNTLQLAQAFHIYLQLQNHAQSISYVGFLRSKQRLGSIVIFNFYQLGLSVFLKFWYAFCILSLRCRRRNYIYKYDYLASTELLYIIMEDRHAFKICFELHKLVSNQIKPARLRRINSLIDMHTVMSCMLHSGLYVLTAYAVLSVELVRSQFYSVYPALSLVGLFGYHLAETHSSQSEGCYHLLLWLVQRCTEKEMLLSSMKNMRVKRTSKMSLFSKELSQIAMTLSVYHS